MNSIGPPVVALVCSAGGLSALQRVLGPLPADFPAAVIVLQHQPPDRVSYLADVLRRHSPLPVRVAQQGDRLAGGTVFVIPPGHHAVVTADNAIALFATNGTPPYRPSADLLLTSMALTAARRSVAVVLSGKGHDAATGATALHDFGGTVIASDRASSTHFDMPEASIERDEVVDHVLPVDDIPPFLVALTAGGEQVPAA
jgi:two-component system chemotaxis response regulator CheB